MDVVCASLAFALLIPVMVVICVAIALESRGPVLFSQRRWGRGGATINVLKFRSMHTALADPSGCLQTVANDPRITRVGSILRRTNLDELPQLINVLRGDMSLVGPRCHPVGMLAAGKAYETLVPNYHLRHVVRPGMTGLAQMRGLRGPTDRPSKARARIACDLHYIETMSIGLDLKILVGTVIAEMRGGKGF